MRYYSEKFKDKVLNLAEGNRLFNNNPQKQYKINDIKKKLESDKPLSESDIKNIRNLILYLIGYVRRFRNDIMETGNAFDILFAIDRNCKDLSSVKMQILND